MKLAEKEQRNVRAALRALKHRAGGWEPVAAALERSKPMIVGIASGRHPVTVELAYGVAKAMGASFDQLLAGTLGICPHCGRHPDEEEFADEGTVVEDKPRDAMLKLLK